MKDLSKIVKQEKIINAIEKTQSSYLVGSGIMPLIRAVPIVGDMISTGVDKALNDFQDRKQMELIDCILKDCEMIKTEQVNDIEFIMNFAKTVEAVRRLATNDKVIYFGHLLRNGYLREEHIDNNDFEELSNIINDLSFREINYLTFFKQNCKNDEIDGNVEWNKFSIEFSAKFKTERFEIYNIFSRLKRTGLIDELYITEGKDIEDDRIEELEIDNRGYYLTRTFDKFYKMVLNNEII